MRHFDIAPFFRAGVGFDQLTNLIDQVTNTDTAQSAYPPYNIEKLADDAWRISIAVAGFGADDLTVETRENALIVAAKRANSDQETQYLHRGIATRAFERRFMLADHVRVSGATHENGMLHIELTREVPEALKPRRIAITQYDAKPGETLEAKAH